MEDTLVKFISNILNNLNVTIDYSILYIILYNLIPAFIFGPYLIYKGYKYNDSIIMIMGFALLVVDTIHFIRNLRHINKTGGLG